MNIDSKTQPSLCHPQGDVFVYIYYQDVLTIICKIDSQWEFAIWLRKLK